MKQDWKPGIELWMVRNPKRYVGEWDEVDERAVLDMCHDRYSLAEEDEFECVATAVHRSYLREIADSIAKGYGACISLLPEVGEESERGNTYPARMCTDASDPEDEYPDVYLFFMADTDGDLRSWY